MKSALSLLAVVGGLLAAAPASAHSFDTILIVPQSGSQAEAGRQARDGVQFAARERDGHADETADGHLGGLDVFILVVDSLAGPGRWAARARELSARPSDDAPWIVAPQEQRDALRAAAPQADFIAIDLTGDAPWDIRTMDGRPFRDAFQQAFGYAPTAAVLAGYGAARQIDAAVRARN